MAANDAVFFCWENAHVQKIVFWRWYYYRILDWILSNYNGCHIMIKAKRFVLEVVIDEYR